MFFDRKPASGLDIYFDRDLMLGLELPEDWEVSNDKEFILILSAPVRDNYQAEMTFKVVKLKPPTAERFEQLVEQEKQEIRQRYGALYHPGATQGTKVDGLVALAYDFEVEAFQVFPAIKQLQYYVFESQSEELLVVTAGWLKSQDIEYSAKFQRILASLEFAPRVLRRKMRWYDPDLQLWLELPHDWELEEASTSFVTVATAPAKTDFTPFVGFNFVEDITADLEQVMNEGEQALAKRVKNYRLIESKLNKIDENPVYLCHSEGQANENGLALTQLSAYVQALTGRVYSIEATCLQQDTAQYYPLFEYIIYLLDFSPAPQIGL